MITDNDRLKCKLIASIGKDGSLIIEVDSEECRGMVIDAVSQNGVSVQYIKPEIPEVHSDLG